MSTREVTAAIEAARTEIAQRYRLCSRDEDRTRRKIVDPVLKGLGWDTALVKPRSREYCCEREYLRGKGKVDYAFFNVGHKAIDGNPPVILIEAKRLDSDLDEGPNYWYQYRSQGSQLPSDRKPVGQLAHYVAAEPRMTKGVAVLTNGKLWRLYDLSKSGWLRQKRVHTVDITKGDSEWSARILHRWLDRSKWCSAP